MDQELLPPRTAKAGFRELVVVCAKCCRRQDLPERALGRRLKRLLKRAGRGKVKVVPSGCLGPCPKAHVAAATPASLRAGRVLLLDPEAPEAILHPAFTPISAPKAE